jgi:hypothetical protein
VRNVREAVFDRCRAQHIEPPSAGRVDRLVRSAFHIFEEHWCASVFEQLGAATQLALDDLIATGSADDETDAEATESRRSVLNELKTDAGAVSLESVITEIAKLERLRSLGLPSGLFDDVSLRVVERFQASDGQDDRAFHIAQASVDQPDGAVREVQSIGRHRIEGVKSELGATN